MRVMVTGINIPVRIGKTLVMPGDVVLADREGLWFIPPHLVKDVVESGEMSKARRLEPHDAGDREIHVASDLRAADAGAAEAAGLDSFVGGNDLLKWKPLRDRHADPIPRRAPR